MTDVAGSMFATAAGHGFPPAVPEVVAVEIERTTTDA
jgi:hypothetical protein